MMGNINCAMRTLFKNNGFTITALLACWFPAWRASRVEPLEALRYE